MNTKNRGDKGEDIALELLKRSGYKIIDRNYNTKYGEIDVVARDGDTLVFVEVKTRLNTRYGQPEEAVTPRKIRHIKMASENYCKKHTGLPAKKRIDIVSIIMKNNAVESYKIIKLD